MTLNATGIAANSQAAGVVNSACGSYSGDSSGSIAVSLGFTPRRVKVIDVSTPITYEYVEGMAATDVLMTIANGTQSIDANSMIVTNASEFTNTEMATNPPGYQAPGEGTTGTVSVGYDAIDHTKPDLTFGTGLNTTSHNYVWYAEG